MRTTGSPSRQQAMRKQRAGEVWRYIVVCQLGWFVCVLSAAHDVGWIGVLFALGAVACHLARVAFPLREGRLIATTVALGLTWESVLVHTGLLTYPSGMLVSGAAPYWMAALWALLAIQFNTLFVWLRSRALLAATLGALAGPLSFRAGAALGAVRFHHYGVALAVLALGWAVLLPTLLHLARRWDGVRLQ